MKKIGILLCAILFAGCSSDEPSDQIVPEATQDEANTRFSLSYKDASNGYRGNTFVVNTEGKIHKVGSQTGTFPPKVETIETNLEVDNGFLAISRDEGDEFKESGLCVGFIKIGELGMIDMNCSMENLVNLYWLSGGRKLNNQSELAKNPVDFFKYDNKGSLKELTQLIANYFVMLDEINDKESLKQDNEEIQTQFLTKMISLLREGESIDDKWIYKELYELSNFKFEKLPKQIAIDPNNEEVFFRLVDSDKSITDKAIYIDYVPWVDLYEVLQNGNLLAITSGGVVTGINPEADLISVQGMYGRYTTETKSLRLK